MCIIRIVVRTDNWQSSQMSLKQITLIHVKEQYIYIRTNVWNINYSARNLFGYIHILLQDKRTRWWNGDHGAVWQYSNLLGNSGPPSTLPHPLHTPPTTQHVDRICYWPATISLPVAGCWPSQSGAKNGRANWQESQAEQGFFNPSTTHLDKVFPLTNNHQHSADPDMKRPHPCTTTWFQSNARQHSTMAHSPLHPHLLH